MPMTEDGGSVADGATVDSVTGQLATRLGIVGETAGQVMRRDVRGVAGGAQSIALLTQADIEGARRIQAPEVPRTVGGAETVAAAHDTPRAGLSTPPGPEPAAAAGPERNGSPAPEPAVPPGPGRTGDVGPEPAAPADAERAAGTGHPGGERPETGGAPATAEREETPNRPASDLPAAPAAPREPQSSPGGAPDPATGASSPDPGAESSGPGGQTPWSQADGSDPGRGQQPGSTPWNSGGGSSMPYMPGMPGGLGGSLTPQERPPRGSAPWSRGRTAGGGETVFPRPRPDDQASTGRPG
ncbi:hypothetical protein [Nocardia sp. NPDC019395]|uniref:hypothetical protein n=1 Tax=Nocardia sp. NPDC019395 TaxID=3154686 RepID=UPI0033FC35D0